MSNRDLPLVRNYEQDHSNNGIIEDLLNGLSEWRSVQDIVRLSIKALADTTKNQGNSIKEVQYYQNEFALKSELSSSLAMKANLSDLSRAIAETRASLDNKINYEEVRAFLDDRVTRNDLLHLLQGKVSIEEFRTAIEFKVDINEMQNEIRGLRMTIEELKNQTAARFEQCASQRDSQVLQRVLETKADIAEMNAALNEKATKTSVANALHKKANKVDVDEILAEKASLHTIESLKAAIEAKVGINSFNTLIGEVEKKADQLHTEKILAYETSRKAEQADVENLYDSLSSLKKEFEIKIQQQAILLGNQLSDVKSENEMNKLSLCSILEKKAEFRDVEKLSEILLKKSDSEELNYLAASLKNEFQPLFQSQQLSYRQELKKIESCFNDQITQFEKQFQSLETEQKYVKDLMYSQAEKSKKELDECFKFIERSKNEETRSLRFDIEKIQRELEDSKADPHKKAFSSDLALVKQNFEDKFDQLAYKLKDFSESTKEVLLKSEKEVAFLTDSLKSKTQDLNHFQNYIEEVKSGTVKREDWENQFDRMQEEVDKLGKDILLKANIKDICTLLDIKANIDDVNHALEEIHQEIDTKVSVDEMAERLREQSCINEALCAENCAGRWLWKSGETKTGSVPWEIQSINTCPENFIWEKDKTTVLTLTPGLYHVHFGVFSRKKCSVQLLVNGEIVISDGNSQGKVIGKHSSGNVVGCTCADYLSLPSRARISITFSGDPSEGFLGLKKL